MATNVFVLALDEHNEQILRDLPDAERYRFHSLLSRAELFGEEIPLCGLLDKAAGQLEAFEESIDAIIGFWDFPVSSMVPILCQRYGNLCCASLEAVVKCEHKYWSRLEQEKVIDEYPRFGLVDPERDTDPPEGVNYPMWIKPVKSASSALAFRVANQQEFQDSLAQIRKGIGRMGPHSRPCLNTLSFPQRSPTLAGRSASPKRRSAVGS